MIQELFIKNFAIIELGKQVQVNQLLLMQSDYSLENVLV